MKVHLKRSGGVGGIAREWKLDDSLFSDEQRSKFKRVLEEADFFSLPGVIPSRSQICDEFSYELAVEYQGKKNKVCCSDSAMPSHLRHCVQWIRDTFETQRESC